MVCGLSDSQGYQGVLCFYLLPLPTLVRLEKTMLLTQPKGGEKKKKESSFERKRAVVESREEFFPIDGKTGRGHLPGKQWNL